MLKSEKKNDQASRLSLSLKCKDCIHFKQGPAFFDKKCSELGVLPEAKACTAFTPDIYKLSKVNEGTVAQIGKVSKDLGPSQLRLLAFTFANMSIMRKHKLKFGQPVFINLSSPHKNYLDCYFKGYVIGASKEGDAVFLTSSLDKKTKSSNVTLSVMRSSILTKKQFDKLAKKLIKEGKRKLPKEDSVSLKWKERPQPPKKESELPEYLKYEIPTIESVPDSWWDRNGPSDDYEWAARLRKFGKEKKGRVDRTNKSGETTTYTVSGRKEQPKSTPKKKLKVKKKAEKAKVKKKPKGKSKNRSDNPKSIKGLRIPITN